MAGVPVGDKEVAATWWFPGRKHMAGHDTRISEMEIARDWERKCHK